jgi:hypothetical protein
MKTPKTTRKNIIKNAGGLIPVASQSFAKLSSDEKVFKQLLVSSEQVILDAANQIIEALPKMHPHSIEDILQSISTISKNLWYLRAECVAELLRRQDPLSGGRSQSAAPGEGRNEFVKEWAEKLKISPTKLREDIRIVEMFSTSMVRDQSGKLQPPPYASGLAPRRIVFSEEEKKLAEAVQPGFRTTLRPTRDGEFIEDFGYTNAKGDILYTAHFSPNPLLKRQYYVVLSKMDDRVEAESKLKEVEQRIQAGEPLTAQTLHDEIFKKSDEQSGFFKLRKNNQYDRAHIELTMRSEDFAVFEEVLKLGLDLKDLKFTSANKLLSILSKSGDGYNIIIQAFRAYLFLLKSAPKKWMVKSTFNPANFTPERMKIRREAEALASEEMHRYVREKKLLNRIKAKLKKTIPQEKRGGEIWEAHKKQLIIVELAQDAVEAAFKSYKEEENYELQQMITKTSADKEKTDLTDQ